MSARPSTRVLLADDHEIVRQGIAQVLEDLPGVAVVGQAGDGARAIALAAELKPDLVILDYGMPGTEPAFVIDHLRKQLPAVKILVLTVHEDVHYALRALEAGAHGYVVKSAAVKELVEAIRAVKEGEVFISPQVSQRILRGLQRPRAKERTGVEALSAREFELLRLLGSGLGLKECAASLNVGVSTASTYRARLMEKLGLQNTAQIIRFALEHEIVG